MPMVRDLLVGRNNPAVASISPESSVLEAARIMNDRHIGAVVVTQTERIVGIFTERDVLRRVVAQQLDPAQTRVGDVMTSPVVGCTLTTPRAECESVMRQRHIRHLPVVDGERVVGMVSVHDLLADEVHEQERTIHYLYEYMYGEWPGPQQLSSYAPTGSV